MRWTRYALLAAATAGPCAASAAARLPVVQPTYHEVVRNFGAEEGLPQNGVNALLQTHDGYLWVGTFGGLARFDGKDFTVFRARQAYGPPEAGIPVGSGPSSDRILSLLEDGRGRLWVGTQDGGLNVYQDGVFYHLPICAASCQISSLLLDDDGMLLVVGPAGLRRLDPLTWSETVLEQRGDYDHLARGGDGRVYASGHGGLAVLEAGKLQPLPLPGARDASIGLLADGQDLLIAGGDGLFRYRLQERRLEPLGARVGALRRAADGALWIERDRRVFRQDADRAWQAVSGLPSMYLTSLFSDHEGNVWVGSHNRGLFRVRRPWIGLLADAEAGLDRPGRAVVSDGAGGLWLGMNCGGLLHWRADGTVQAPLRNGECVSSLLRDRGGQLWVGLVQGMLGRLHDGRLERILTWRPGAAGGVWQADDGGYWATSEGNTYRLYFDASGRLLRQARVPALEGMAVNSIRAAKGGGLWFTGDQGAVRLLDERVVERWTPVNGLSSRFARAVHEDDQGVLWIGTYGGGLNRIEDGQVRHYRQSEGLFDDTVSCILPDGEGNLWFGGNRGISMLSAAQRRHGGDRIEVQGFTAVDGLVPAEINGGTLSACHRAGDGRLWFSLVQGFAVVDPAGAKQRTSRTLPVHIERALVAGRPQYIGRPLQLGVSARNLEIHYSAVNLTTPEQTRFRFRLSGLDQDWIEAGASRSILYPSIPWGSHLFEVQARNEGAAWPATSAQLWIHHPAPWYQRPWVWVLTVLIGLAVLVGGSHHADSGRDGRYRTRLSRLDGSGPGRDPG